MTDKLKEGISLEEAAACEVMVEYPGANILWLESGGELHAGVIRAVVKLVALKECETTNKRERLESL